MDSLSDIEDTLADETTRLTEAAEPKLSSMVLKNDEAAVAKGDEVRTEQPQCSEDSDGVVEVTMAPPDQKDDVPVSVVVVAEDTISRVSSVQGDMCRICHCVTEETETLISPCDCKGSMKWVHQACLQRWVKSSDTKKCELCGFSYNMISSVKPFSQWKKLNMSSVERRKVLCSVTFHVVAITCVIWSLYVLIDRTTQEIQDGNLNWPFWTKLVVVAIGFTGGLVFMYVQCKMYVQLFKKWKQFNRVIYINNVMASTDFDGIILNDTSPNDTVAIDIVTPSLVAEPDTSTTSTTSADKPHT